MNKSKISIDMPDSYYWKGLDNFFEKLTAMESPRKNNDCYFYYYSTCTKGDSCTFRHEPSALGCETMCLYWQQGKCLNQHCNFRHMELRVKKNRKAIPCYWETQPSGCRKPHCPFLHKTPREPLSGDLLKSNEGTSEPKNEITDWHRRQAEGNHYEQTTVNEISSNDIDARRLGATNEGTTYASPAVDPLVVNFEEESDNESVTTTPIKYTPRIAQLNELEQIQLEKIQAESAAFYSYEDRHSTDESDDLRQRILSRLNVSKNQNITDVSINARKRKIASDLVKRKSQNSNVENIKIKTLDEIRAERSVKKDIMTEHKLESSKTDDPIPLKRRLLRRFGNNYVSKSTLTEEQQTVDISCSTVSSSDGLVREMSASSPNSFNKIENEQFSPSCSNLDNNESEDIIMNNTLKPTTSNNAQTVSIVPDLLASCVKVPELNQNQDEAEDLSLLDDDTVDSGNPDESLPLDDDILRDIDELLDD